MISRLLPALAIDDVIHELALPVVLFNRRQILYANDAAVKLTARLQVEHGSDLAVLLRDHLDSVAPHVRRTGQAVTVITAGNGELFYLHLRHVVLKGRGAGIVACVRQMAPEREAVTRHFQLSRREAQVVDLVLKGYGNRDVALALGIAEATAKKHLGSIFDKVGVDSRSQLISRLA